jgi:hypothetical protein
LNQVRLQTPSALLRQRIERARLALEQKQLKEQALSDSAPQETLIKNMDSTEPMPDSEQDTCTPDLEQPAVEDVSSLTSTTVEIPPAIEDVPANQVESLSESQV